MIKPKVGQIWKFQFAKGIDVHVEVGTISYIDDNIAEFNLGTHRHSYNLSYITFLELFKSLYDIQGLTPKEMFERQRFFNKYPEHHIASKPKPGEIWYVRTSEYLAKVEVIFYGTTVVEFKHHNRNAISIILKKEIEFLERFNG